MKKYDLVCYPFQIGMYANLLLQCLLQTGGDRLTLIVPYAGVFAERLFAYPEFLCRKNKNPVLIGRDSCTKVFPLHTLDITFWA